MKSGNTALELPEADSQRLMAVLDDLHQRLRGMVDWLSSLEQHGGQQSINQAVAELRAEFVPADPANYTLAEFSRLWGITDNPFSHILAYADCDPDSQPKLAAAMHRFSQQLAQIPADCIARLETRLNEPDTAKRALSSLRRFHDLWIDCAEASFAQIASTDEFCQAQAAVFNELFAQRNQAAA